MDFIVVSFCKDNYIEIFVFDMNKFGNILKVVKGEDIGIVVRNGVNL